MDEGYSAVIGTSIRWDVMNIDYLLFQRTTGLEFEVEGYVGAHDVLMPNLSIYASAQVGRLLLLDFTTGVGYCKPNTFGEPALVIRVGLGISVGGGVY